MGVIFFHTGLGGRMFPAIGRLLGRLSYVMVLGGTCVSTLSESSMGSTALLESLIVPEMTRRGYKNTCRSARSLARAVSPSSSRLGFGGAARNSGAD